MNRDALQLQAEAVLGFWLQDGMRLGWPSQDAETLWFGGGPALDAQIDARFGHQVRDAIAGGLQDWENEARNRLALVILLDQFTRNVFRRQAQAFSGDARAQSLVTNALANGWDAKLPLAGRAFLYMPLTHAESSTLQEEGVRRFRLLLEDAPAERKKDIEEFLKSANQHREVIASFGRFPHRNAVLGRQNTPRETEFLQDGARFGQ